MAEDLTEAEVGELLFQIVSACDRSGIDAESALRKFSSTLVREIEAQG